MIIQGVTLTGVTVVDATIVPGAVVNLDPATGLSGSTWTNTGSLGTTLNYTLFNSPSTATVNDTTVLSFPGGNAQNPGSMTLPYAFNSTGFTAMGAASQAFTLEIWASPRATNAGCLIKEYGQQSGGVPISGWEDAWINFYNNGSTSVINTATWSSIGNTYASAGNYTLNSWYCICMVYNGSNQLLTYLNGTLASTQNYSRASQGTNCMFTIAGCERYPYLGPAAPGSSPYFTGYVGPFKMYYSVLTAAQIEQNYNALRGRYGL